MDASSVLAWLFQEDAPLVEEFWTSLSDADELVAAALLFAECTSNIRTAVYDRRLDSVDGNLLISRLTALPVRVASSPGQSQRAYQLAERFQTRKAYDMHYLAAAEIEQAELVTIDRGLRHAGIESRVPVRFLI